MSELTPVFEVDYEIRSGIDNHETAVADGTMYVAAPTEQAAADAVTTYIEDADLRFDDRIDPVVKITNVEDTDPETLSRFAYALACLAGPQYTVLDADETVRVHGTPLTTYLVLTTPTESSRVVTISKATKNRLASRRPGFEWEGPEGDPDFEQIAFLIAQSVDGYLA